MLISPSERTRLVAWAGVAACAAFAWTLFAATADPSEVDAKRLLAGVGLTLAAVALLGGAIVPRRSASWSALFIECVAGAGAISLGSVLATASAEENHPLALGFWSAFTFVASAVVVAPLFLSAYAGRAGLLRALQRA